MTHGKFTHIFFDVGGVVIQDFSGTNKWDEMIGSMGVNSENKDRYQEIWNKYKHRRCIDFDVDLMIDELRNYVGLDLAEGFSFLEQFVDRFNPNPSIVPVLKYAKSISKIGLITNMYPRMLDKIYNRKGLMPNIKWDYTFDSSVIKLEKPDRKIFEFVQMKINALEDNKILFVDNSEENLIEPTKLGWDTFLYESRNPESSSDKLFNIINLNK